MTASPTMSATRATFHSRKGRARTTRIQKETIRSVIVAPVPGCQRATSARPSRRPDRAPGGELVARDAVVLPARGRTRTPRDPRPRRPARRNAGCGPGSPGDSGACWARARGRTPGCRWSGPTRASGAAGGTGTAGDQRRRKDGDEAHRVLRHEEVGDAFDVGDDPAPLREHSGRCENLPSSRTSSATAFVACAPLPIATPMSASLSASASLTPSPVIATTWPSACRAWTKARFCSGVTRPKTCPWRGPHAGSPGRRPGCGRRGFTDVEPDRASHGGHGDGVVAGDDLDRDVLLGEVGERPAASGRTCSVRVTRAPGMRSGGSVASVSARRCGRGARRAGPRPRARRPGADRRTRLAGRRSSTSGAPSTHVSRPCETRRAPLPRRVERDRLRAAPARGLEAAATAVSVPLALGSSARRPAPTDLVLVLASEARVLEGDVTGGQRPRLVEADDVDARQPLHRRQLLHEHLRRVSCTADRRKATDVRSTRPSGTSPTTPAAERMTTSASPGRRRCATGTRSRWAGPPR